MNDSNPIDVLKHSISIFASRNPDSVVTFKRGYRLIVEGTLATDCFLIQEGSLSIIVRHPLDGKENIIALRFNGDLIGETAILEERGNRNATVEVASLTATLIRLSREDVLSLIRDDVRNESAFLSIWGLAASRRAETEQVLAGGVHVEIRLISVLLADIHDFTMLGEKVWDEQSDIFLFEFINGAETISEDLDGLFEEQGDGFKVAFSGENHVGRAVACAAELRRTFCDLRLTWAERSEAFRDIGLGVSVCTNMIAIRRKVDSVPGTGRIGAHTIRLAAAIAKLKSDPSDVDVYLDDFTAAMLRSNNFKAGPKEEKWLHLIGRRQTLHRLIVNPERNSMSGPHQSPHSYTTAKVPLNAAHCATVSPKRAMSGASRCSGMVGMSS